MALRVSAVLDPLNYSSRERYQFTGVTEEFLIWGYGEYACPGRFYATQLIKLILVNILLGYDMKMPDGLAERYPDVSVGMIRTPDVSKEILFRKARA